MFRLMIVEKDLANCRLLREMLQDNFKLSFCNSASQAVLQASISQPSLIIISISMPSPGGFELCRRLKAKPRTARIPLIMFSEKHEYLEEVRAFKTGGVDYIAKPFSGDSILTRLDTHIALYNQQQLFEERLQDRTVEIEKNQITALTMLADAGHYNDTDTGVHIWRMAAYAGALARAKGWAFDDAHQMALGAALHDTGKIGIPDSVLKKPAKLTTAEFDTIKAHTKIGYNILHHSEHPGRIFELGAEIAIGHHEKWDGSGYPEGLVGEEIPESARIAAIVDVFDALTMKRAYKNAWSNDEAFALIREEAGTHFDPVIVEIFFSIQEEILDLKDKWHNIEKNNLLYTDLENIIRDL